METIVGVFGNLPASSSRNDDDFSDRLSYRYTSAILILFAIIVSTKQYVGEPIQCWVPAHFTGNHVQYTNDYCWVRNTYYLPYEEYVPHEHETDKRAMIPYYQWIPMIMLVQSLLFYMPIVAWRTLNGRSGIDVSNIVESGETFINTQKSDERENTLQYMTSQMHRYLSSQNFGPKNCTISAQHILSRTCCIACGRRRGNYLISLYILVKLLFLFNAIGQLFLLNTFLGHSFYLYGIDVIRAVVKGEDWASSYRFPRVTMCDFKVRRLGNVQRYTVQCVLPINLFNEMIYLFIWFWMVFVAVMIVISLITWLSRAACRYDRHRYIKKHLVLMQKLQSDGDKKRAVRFVENYLKQDGVLVMRLVGHNTNAITVTEFVCSLWDNYCNISAAESL